MALEINLQAKIKRMTILELRRNLQVLHNSPTISGWQMLNVTIADACGCGSQRFCHGFLAQFNLNRGVICAGNGLDSFENGD